MTNEPSPLLPELTRAEVREAPLSRPALPTTSLPDTARKKRRDFGKQVRRALLAVGLVAATTASVVALRPRPASVDAARVVHGPLAVVVEESGKTRVKNRYLVSAPVAGHLTRVPWDPGDLVREGDVLAVITPGSAPLLDRRARAEAEARVAAAQAGLERARVQITRAATADELAKKELARLQLLAQRGAATRQALEQAELEAQMSAQDVSSTQFAAKVAAEEVRLTRAAITQMAGSRPDRPLAVFAPTSGRVLHVQQKSEGVIGAGTPLLELGDPTALEVVVDLLTTAAVNVRVGTEVAIHGWGGDAPLGGRVRLIEPSGFTRPSALGVDEQRVNVIVALTDPRPNWATLGDGYRVETRLVLWQSQNVLKAPQGAVFRHADGWAVFRLVRSRARLTPVVLGHRGETDVEIRSGLDAGDAVAVHPGDRVSDGVRVAVR